MKGPRAIGAVLLAVGALFLVVGSRR